MNAIHMTASAAIHGGKLTRMRSPRKAMPGAAYREETRRMPHPRQSRSCLIFWSMIVEADSITHPFSSCAAKAAKSGGSLFWFGTSSSAFEPG